MQDKELDNIYDLELEVEEDEEEVTLGVELPDDCFYQIMAPQGKFSFLTKGEYESPYHALGHLMETLASDERTQDLLAEYGFWVTKE